MFALLETLVKIASVGFISLLVAANIISPQNPENNSYVYEKKVSNISTSTPPLNPPTNPLENLLATTTEKVSTSTPTKVVKVATTTIPKTSATNPVKEIVKPIEEKLKLSIKQVEEAPKILPTASEVNELARKAAVNILCYTETAGSLRPLTGSGIIIDERGVVLTNAHLGQYFLLRDYPVKDNVTCLIRTGSPATPTYRGEILYISPPWIEENKKNIIEENPLGTGEHDFSLILITGMVDKNLKLPSTFPYVPFNTEEMDEKKILSDSYVVVAYPAGFLGGLTVLQNLYISSTVSTIKQFFTFKSLTLDVISLGGSVLAQKGSSGGAVVRVSDKSTVGIIVTTTSENTTSERDLRAITLAHINRSISAVTNQSLSEYLSGDLIKKVNEFRLTRFNYLKDLLVSQITSQ